VNAGSLCSRKAPPVAERGYPLDRADGSYFFTPETATHFGGVPERICPEGQGSVGFGAVEGGPLCVLGAEGADGMACELVAPGLVDDDDLFCAKAPLLAWRASIPAAMMATRTTLLIKLPTFGAKGQPAENAGSSLRIPSWKSRDTEPPACCCTSPRCRRPMGLAISGQPRWRGSTTSTRRAKADGRPCR
jgi:hypothetical protein